MWHDHREAILCRCLSRHAALPVMAAMPVGERCALWSKVLRFQIHGLLYATGSCSCMTRLQTRLISCNNNTVLTSADLTVPVKSNQVLITSQYVSCAIHADCMHTNMLSLLCASL